MGFIDFKYYVYLSVMCIVTHQMNSQILLQPLKREVRYTKFDFHYSNESIGSVLECTFKQFPEKQTLFLRTIVHEKITEINGMCSVSKCKDYYVDCVNVVAYEVNDVCHKLNLITSFANSGNSKQILNKCPIIGEYYYKNLTFEADKFGAVFGLPTEKWWELYWKINLKIYNKEKTMTAFINMEFYFIQFRSRNRQH